MEWFADTANMEELDNLDALGVIDGVTTNPKIVSNEKGVDFKTHMKKILTRFEGRPVSIEVTTNDYAEMVSQARDINKWGNNVVVKLPMNDPGMRAVATLSKEGIKTNVTACMSSRQALFAAKAGATYVSLFWARIEDMGHDAFKEVKDTSDVLRMHNMPAKIIVGSFRQQSHINQALRSGAHVLTIPTKIIKDMIQHPRTDSTIDEFLETWADFSKETAKK